MTLSASNLECFVSAGTGNTVIEAVKVLTEHRVQPRHIILLSLFSTPHGIAPQLLANLLLSTRRLTQLASNLLSALVPAISLCSYKTLLETVPFSAAAELLGYSTSNSFI